MGRPTNAERRAKLQAEKEAEKLVKEQANMTKEKISKPVEKKVEKVVPKSEVNIERLDKKLEEHTNFEIDNNSKSDTTTIQNQSTVVNTNAENQPTHQFTMPEIEDETMASHEDTDEFFGEQNTGEIIDPLEEPVIKRNYTDGALGNQQSGGATNTGNPVIEPIIPEPTIKVPPIIDPNATTNTGNPVDPNGNGTPPPQTPPQPKANVNPDLQDMSHSQKKKAAEKAADALIQAYVKVIPIVPKKLSSVNMRKLQKMEMDDVIDTNMVVLEDENGDVTVKQFCEGVNQQVEQTFVITEDMQNEIREPLIEVLMENNIALTPTQRLLMAVGGQIVQMGISTIQFMNVNKDALKTFERFHRENKEQGATTRHSKKHAVQFASRKAQEEAEQAERERQEMEYEARKEEQRQEAIKRAQEKEAKDKIDLEDALKRTEENKDEKKSDIKVDDVLTPENGGITVEEVK